MSDLAERLVPYLDDHAVTLVDHYVNSGCFTGRAFDTLDTGAGNPSARITADDLLAVAMLASPIRPSARRGGITPAQALVLTSASEPAGWLEQVPDDVDLHDLDGAQAAEHVGDDAPASRLFNWIVEEVGLGVTPAYKLLARKRPRLLPVSDRQVRKALHPTGNWWMPVWETLHHRPDLVEQIQRLAARARAEQLSILRTLDVAVWMRVRGAGQCPCDLEAGSPA